MDGNRIVIYRIQLAIRHNEQKHKLLPIENVQHFCSSYFVHLVVVICSDHSLVFSENWLHVFEMVAQGWFVLINGVYHKSLTLMQIRAILVLASLQSAVHLF